MEEGWTQDECNDMADQAIEAGYWEVKDGTLFLTEAGYQYMRDHP